MIGRSLIMKTVNVNKSLVFAKAISFVLAFATLLPILTISAS